MKHPLPALLSVMLAFSSVASPAQLKEPEEKKEGEKTEEKDSKKEDKGKDKEKEKRPRTEQETARIRDRNRRKAEEAWARDNKKRKAKEYAEMEKEYQEINANFKAANVKQLLEAFIKKWKDGNRVGCATMYLAQKSGGAEKEKLLETCINKFSDAYYLDGCSVGALSRLYLASWHQQNGKNAAAKKLIEEIDKSWSDAQDHSGNIIGDMAAELKKK